MRNSIAKLVAAFVVLIGGCATTPPEGRAFSELRAPAPDKARIYVLRPRFTLLKGSGELSLLHDSKPVATLVYDQYIDFNVDPGRHVLTLEPGLLNSSVYRRQLTLDARAGSTYFLAYWTNLAPVGGLSFFPGGGALPFIVLPNNESRILQVRFEEVPQGGALEALSTLFRTPRFLGTDE